MVKGKFKRKKMLRELRGVNIKDYGLPSRIVFVLEMYGLTTISDLDLWSLEKLKNFAGIGEKL